MRSYAVGKGADPPAARFDMIDVMGFDFDIVWDIVSLEYVPA